MIKKIEIKYVHRDTSCPVSMTFYGTNADSLAVNYQSAHPELKLSEVSFNIIPQKELVLT